MSPPDSFISRAAWQLTRIYQTEETIFIPMRNHRYLSIITSALTFLSHHSRTLVCDFEENDMLKEGYQSWAERLSHYAEDLKNSKDFPETISEVELSKETIEEAIEMADTLMKGITQKRNKYLQNYTAIDLDKMEHIGESSGIESIENADYSGDEETQTMLQILKNDLSHLPEETEIVLEQFARDTFDIAAEQTYLRTVLRIVSYPESK